MVSSQKIAISGAHGFIGSKLCEALNRAGYQVMPLVRKRSSKQNEIFYDYNRNEIDLNKLSQCFAVIHLAGKNILSGLWTKKVKKELYDSRIKSTQFIAKSLAKLKDGPRILLCASATGIYGDKADLKLDENSHCGDTFLARLCIDWEAATIDAKKAGLRVVNMRFGIVLDKDGGMLKLLALVFKYGLGGYLGSGAQYFSYVTRNELVAQILFILKTPNIFGPVNLVAKEPTTNKEFTQALAKVLHRPAFMHIPSFLLKLLGDQGKMILASTRAYPKVLLDHGFSFEDKTILHVLSKIYEK